MMALKMKCWRRRSALIGFTLAAAALLLALLLPTDSFAASCGTEKDYYDSASYSRLVGVVAYTPVECGCSRYAWGVVTSYVRIGGVYCLPPPI